MSLFDSARRAILGRDYDDYDEEYDEEYDDYEEERPRRGLFSFFSRDKYDEEEYEEPAPRRTSSITSSRDRRSVPASSSRSGSYSKAAISYGAKDISGVEITLITPITFDDSSKIVREVKNGKVAIFDMSGVTEIEEARRIVDYICGAAEGMDCPFSRICPSVFCMAPKGVVINGRKTKY